MLKSTILAISGILASVSMAAATNYTIDPVHSQIQFSVPHLVAFTVRGDFRDFNGSVNFDPTTGRLQAAEAIIEVSSIDTREPKRDEHLKSPDFFAAEQYPAMTFKSSHVEGQGNNITVTGDLTIRGTTKKVNLIGSYQGSNTDPWGNERVGFRAETTINRRDFGLNWNQALETGGVLVGEDVTISLDIQAIKDK